ncbi:ribonuclease T2 family protein [Vannielia litorea]|uniref:ribonuclease T2 family protein n=1 Tax=Vannielia litorea TaxID=1217970 RepID=UPI001C978049|nr:ribonuclease T2 [Vannielia litorea]MBY6049714.1 ribonuclease T2 [Vannielia litorea]MBY6077128.1 ribonuclease T2 [Vannielia litorea]
MRAWIAAILLGLAGPAWAEGERAGDFDYYVMSLSWSPNWCALEGRAKGSPQCDRGRGYGWVLHGLWPQYERGWPSFCRTAERDPSRSDTAQMADIMGTSGLAWYQWKKHGRCAGLSSAAYFAAAREAYGSVTRPEVFRKLKDPITLPASVVEEAWLKDNPDLGADMLTVTCKAGRIQEVRICLTKDLEPRDCGRDVVRDCTMRDAGFEPIR